MKRYLDILSDREDSININIDNVIRLIIIELIWNTIFDVNSTKKEIIEKIEIVLWEKQNKWISLILKNRIREYRKNKIKELNLLEINFETYIKTKMVESPEVFIKSIITEIWLDFYDVEKNWIKNINVIKDIPIQARESNDSWIEQQFNWTVWILKNSRWNIVSNQRIIDVLLNKELINQDNINNILNYLAWAWSEVFRKTIELLIKQEEQIYWWGELKWKSTKIYFIPWGGGWLTIARDFFIEEWELVCVPNYRWPNIDWIITSRTKTPTVTLDLIWENWELNFNSLEDAIINSLELSRKKITFYFNFPANPTGTTISDNDWNKINWIFKKYEDKIQIQIILDDPYWAFNLDSGWNVRKPLSYHIDTNNNISIIEIWSHWTKEAWIYWLRTWTLRIISNKDKTDIVENKLNKAIRETFSMSPTLPQMILIKAILWDKIDAFNLNWNNKNNEYLYNLSDSEIENRIKRYLELRIDMFKEIFPKIEKIRDTITDECWKYLKSMCNIQYWEKNTWWFMVCFWLTEKAKIMWLNLEELRRLSNKKWKEWIWFTTFLDNINNEVVIRITLFSWDEKVYAKRLKNFIIELLN